jgi:hypothetical protein
MPPTTEQRARWFTTLLARELSAFDELGDELPGRATPWKSRVLVETYDDAYPYFDATNCPRFMLVVEQGRHHTAGVHRFGCETLEDVRAALALQLVYCADEQVAGIYDLETDGEIAYVVQVAFPAYDTDNDNLPQD